MMDGDTWSVFIEAQFEGVEREWDELATRCGALPFLRPGWVKRWWHAFGTGKLEIVGIRRNGTLAAVLPVFRPSRRSPSFKAEPFPLTARHMTLRATANWHTPYFGSVADTDAALAKLAEEVLKHSGRVVSLGFVDPGGRDFRAFGRAVKEAAWRTHVVRLPPVPYVSCVGDWASFEDRLSGKMLRDLRRRARRLQEKGPIDLEVACARDELDTFLAEGFRLESSGWKDRQRSAIRSRAETQQFYTQVAHWAAERGWLRLAFLRVNRQPLAFQLGIEANGTYYFLKGGYDPGYSAFAPSRLLLQRMLTRAYDVGLDRFDFVGGAEPWKLDWTSTCRERVVLHAFAPTLLGAAERFAVTVSPTRARLRTSLMQHARLSP